MGYGIRPTGDPSRFQQPQIPATEMILAALQSLGALGGQGVDWISQQGPQLDPTNPALQALASGSPGTLTAGPAQPGILPGGPPQFGGGGIDPTNPAIAALGGAGPSVNLPPLGGPTLGGLAQQGAQAAFPNASPLDILGLAGPVGAPRLDLAGASMPASPYEAGQAVRGIPGRLVDTIANSDIGRALREATGQAGYAYEEGVKPFIAGLTGDVPARAGVPEYLEAPPPEFQAGTKTDTKGAAEAGAEAKAVGQQPGDEYDTGIKYDVPRRRVEKPEEIPPPDLGPVQRQLEAARPKEPTLLTREDLLLSTLAGLAGGAMSAGPHARVGQILAGAGAGGIGGLERGREENVRRTERHEQEMHEQNLLEAKANADAILAAHGVNAQNIQARNAYKADQALADYQYELEVMPKVHTTDYGTTYTWRDPDTGTLRRKTTLGPAATIALIANQTREKTALYNALTRGRGGKGATTISMPGMGEVDYTTLGPQALPGLGAFGWTNFSAQGQAQVRAVLDDLQNDPEKYGAGGIAANTAILSGKYDKAKDWAIEYVAQKRLGDMNQAMTDGNRELYQQLAEEHMRYVPDLATIQQNRFNAGFLGSLSSDAETLGDPWGSWVSGVGVGP